MAVFVAGQNIDGQGGIASGNEQIFDFTSFTSDSIEGKKISRIANSRSQTFVLTDDGSVYSAGCNEAGELGRSGKRSLFIKLESLEAFVCTDVAIGDGFVILILNDGRQISWGRSEMGQLGLGNRENKEKPKRASILSSVPGELGFIQISAGGQHCVAISVRGNVFTWGGNRTGQLGDGFLNSCPSPTIVPQLKHRPVVSVVAGENHCLVMTVGGNLYSWGDNGQGQLGHGDTTKRLRPELVRSLKIAQASSIAAGKAHSLCSAKNGLLFAFGSNFYGQLGLGLDADSFSVPSPAVVEKLRGKQVVEVSCGDTHSLMVCQERDSEGKDRRVLYVAGQSSVGQLGLGASRTSPLRTPERHDLASLARDGRELKSASCGGPTSLLSFVITEGVPFKRMSLPSIDLASLRLQTDKLRSQKEALETAKDLGSGNQKQLASLYSATLQGLRERVAAAFSSISVLNASFRLEASSQQQQADMNTSSSLCIDLEQVRAAYSLLVEAREEQLMNTLSRATMQMTELLREVPTDSAENLSVFLIAFENPLMLRPQHSFFSLERLVNGILALQKVARQQLFGWLRHYPSQFFATVVEVTQNYLSFCLAPMSTGAKADPAPAVMVLESLYEVNSEKRIIPNALFVNATLPRARDLLKEREDHSSARAQGLTQVFNFLDFPFLLSAQAKSVFMRRDFAELKQAMQVQVFLHLGQNQYLLTRDGHNAIYVPRESHPLPPGLRIASGDESVVDASAQERQRIAIGPTSLLFSVKVRRDSLLDDFLQTMRSVCQADPRILALPLSVEFEGESGVDAGGLTKELLTLAIQALVARTGVVTTTNGGRHVWFTRTEPTLHVLEPPPAPPAVSSPLLLREGASLTDVGHQVDTLYEERGLRNPGTPERVTRPRLQADPARSDNAPPSAPSRGGAGAEGTGWHGGLSGCFSFDEDTATLCRLHDAEFTLGLLYGFASYNSCLVNLPLPPCLYKVMHAVDPSRPLMRADETAEKLRTALTLEDLTEVEPSLAAGLRALLEWEEGNLEEVFGADFTASANPLVADRGAGRCGRVELVVGGADQGVKKSNRELYVSKLVKHALHDCCASAVKAFLAGLTINFKGKTVTELCTSEELEELLCGSRDIGDLSLLRIHTTYRGKFDDEHPCVNYLWEILSELPTVQQRRFLTFVTGSDRVPVGGIENVKLVVQSTGQDPSALPAAHTCFNTLDLPVYQSAQQMKQKLLQALEHAEGFGLA